MDDDSSLRYRKADERREWITQALRREGFLSIAELTRELGVSHMTVRRDLQHLEQAGYARLVHGGVSLSSITVGDAVGTDESSRRIAACAAALVGENDTIAIDAGRLGCEVARTLPDRFRGTVVTHSLPVIQSLMGRPHPPRVVGLGGELLAEIGAFVGASTVAAAANVRVGTLFLAPDGLNDRGAYARADAEASVKRALLDVADRTVVIAHHRSFVDPAPLLVSRLSRVTTLVTTQRPPSRVERALRLAGVSVLIGDGGQPTASPDEPGHADQVDPPDNGSRQPATVTFVSRRRAAI